MADYLPLYKPGQDIPMTATAAVIGGQLVYISGTRSVAPTTGTTNAWLGVAISDAAVGAQVTVMTGGVQYITAVGAITAGQNVEPAAGGGVAAHTNGTNDFNTVGVALDTVANGARVPVKLYRG